jgi:hypothetical protein
MNFPADSFKIPSSPQGYVKLFLPPAAMAIEKEPLYDFGLTGLKSFLNTSFNKPTMLQKTINPKEACLFYFVLISVASNKGAARARLFLKDKRFIL